MARTKLNQEQYGEKYSTTEQLTGDVWIDGKPIYRKTVSLGAMPNSTSKNVAHGITGLDRVVRMTGTAKEGTVHVPLPFADLTLSGQFTVFISGANIVLGAGVNRSGYTGYLTIEYTKT